MFQAVTSFGELLEPQLIWSKQSAGSVADSNCAALTNCAAGLAWAIEGLRMANISLDWFTVQLVTRSREFATVLKAGKARSVVLSKVISEIRANVNLFPAWEVTVKEKGKSDGKSER